MANKNVTLKDVNGNSCFPKTFDYNVYNSDNESLDNVLAEKVEFEETSETTITPSALLNLIYPVGSIRLSLNSGETSFMGGTWQLVGSGKVLVGAGASAGTNNISVAAGETEDAGLPNITASGRTYLGIPDGAIRTLTIQNSNASGGDNTNYPIGTFDFDAHRSSSIYGNSQTVQPPSFGVYFYQRIS